MRFVVCGPKVVLIYYILPRLRDYIPFFPPIHHHEIPWNHHGIPLKKIHWNPYEVPMKSLWTMKNHHEKWWSVKNSIKNPLKSHSPADPRRQLQLVRLVLFRQGHLFGHLISSWWVWESIVKIWWFLTESAPNPPYKSCGISWFSMGILALWWHDIKYKMESITRDSWGFQISRST